MADKIAADKRSLIMSYVRQRDTQPEMIVRTLLHRMGYRFRLHRKDLPGKPDIVLPRHWKAIWVHGCFWHCHRGCRRATRLATNVEFWERKIEKNMERDARVREEIEELGWSTLTIWQCELRDIATVQCTLRRFLEEGRR